MSDETTVRAKRGNNVTATRKLNGKPQVTHPKGRTCFRCNAALSIYNPDELCGPCKKAGK